MSKLKRSGHARLKAALVLRDALAAELGLDLSAAMAQLGTVEEGLGAAAGLAEGKYLDALVSVCQGGGSLLAGLDAEVRQACTAVRLTPRYAQYLALVLFGRWVDAQLDDAAAFVARLNAFLDAHPPKDERVEPFVESDLQLAAFWMATAAGKTHILHASLAMLTGRVRWDRIVLITPSESLTRQHADRLRSLAAWPLFAYPMDGDSSALGYLAPDTVIVLDINKLTAQKKGDGVTVPISAFSEGRNLVFVDEGHKGQKSEASVWKALQADLAGIGAPSPGQRGLLIELSATFGQVAEGEHAFARYAKSVVLDYAYDRFHADRYGKDFWHLRIQADTDASAAAQDQTLTAALLCYWHQLASFRSPAAAQSAADLGLGLAQPLWVLLGLSVIGGKNKEDREQTSDVVEVLRYLWAIALDPRFLESRLAGLLAIAGGDAELIPGSVRQAAGALAPGSLAVTILRDCFGWQTGDKPVLRLIRCVVGELGIGLKRGERVRYFGVVNVGDAPGLRKALEAVRLPVEDDSVSESLFGAIDSPQSGLNVLIGSRRFAEGWDNYRASSLTLLRLGQGEGSLIIQMFGRVVRFAGVRGDGKRLAQPPALLAPLQTAYVFGLKSGYLSAFLKGLTDNGVLGRRSQSCPVSRFVPPVLRSVQARVPPKTELHLAASGTEWLKSIPRPITVSLGATVANAALRDGQVADQAGRVAEDLTASFRRWLPILDLDRVYRDLAQWRRNQGRWNLTFDSAAVAAALASDRYTLLGLPAALAVHESADLARLQRLAAVLVRGMLEAAYRRQENRLSRFVPVPAQEGGIPDCYYKEIPLGD